MGQETWLPIIFVLIFVLSWANIARAVLVDAQKLPPNCPDCWRRYERTHLGESVCSCGR